MPTDTLILVIFALVMFWPALTSARRLRMAERVLRETNARLDAAERQMDEEWMERRNTARNFDEPVPAAAFVVSVTPGSRPSIEGFRVLGPGELRYPRPPDSPEASP